MLKPIPGPGIDFGENFNSNNEPVDPPGLSFKFPVKIIFYFRYFQSFKLNLKSPTNIKPTIYTRCVGNRVYSTQVGVYLLCRQYE